ncbi:MAG: hypothetical protein WBM53_10680, partial [Maribacter sp.]
MCKQKNHLIFAPALGLRSWGFCNGEGFIPVFFVVHWNIVKTAYSVHRTVHRINKNFESRDGAGRTS